MTETDILYGYFGVFEIEKVDIFEYIRMNKDDFLWERGFRPAFTEEKYIRSDEKRRIILTPACIFEVEIEPQPKNIADEQLEKTRSLIKELRDIIAPDAEIRQKDLKYILLFHQPPNIETLLPRWYLTAVGRSNIKLKGFKTFIEDIKEEKVRQTKVLLKIKEGVLEIKIVSPDLDLAKGLVDSIRKSCQGE